MEIIVHIGDVIISLKSCNMPNKDHIYDLFLKYSELIINLAEKSVRLLFFFLKKFIVLCVLNYPGSNILVNS